MRTAPPQVCRACGLASGLQRARRLWCDPSGGRCHVGEKVINGAVGGVHGLHIPRDEMPRVNNHSGVSERVQVQGESRSFQVHRLLEAEAPKPKGGHCKVPPQERALQGSILMCGILLHHRVLTGHVTRDVASPGLHVSADLLRESVKGHSIPSIVS